jgi:hypothetical protein
VLHILARAERELTPGRGVLVVLDHDREVHSPLELGPQWLVTPGEIGGGRERSTGWSR